MTKSTRRALLSSVVALVLCLTMLIGTTFAWFTDTASTAVNTIQSGTLDVELGSYINDEWVSLEGKTLSWQKAAERGNEEVLWEPGCTYKLQEVVIRNNGNLALKYVVAISGIKGDAKLNEAITWTIEVDGEDHLLPGEKATLTISGHMKEDAGNEYQGLSIDGAAITVYATQYTHEYDSNNNTYDENATLPSIWNGTTEYPAHEDGTNEYHIQNAAQFATFFGGEYSIPAGSTVYLDCDVDLGGKTITGYYQGTFDSNFDGQGHTVSNFTVTNTTPNDNKYHSALFSHLTRDRYVKNLTVKNASSIALDGVGMVGMIVGGANDNATVENCHVVNCTVVGEKKVGGVVGYIGSATVTNCSATDCAVYCAVSEDTASAGINHQAGAVLGFNDNGTYTNDNTSENVTVAFNAKPVSTADELKTALTPNGQNTNLGTIVLTNDITVENWTAISANYTSFVLDGNGHSISGLTDALIEAIGPNCTVTVKNLTLKNVDIYDNTVDENVPRAALFNEIDCEGGNVNLTIDNCHVVGGSIHSWKYAGGFIGIVGGGINNSVVIKNSTVKNVDISTTDSSVGGLVGHTHSNVTFENCSILGYTTVKCEENRSGGAAKAGTLIGTVNVGTTTITNCTVDDTVELNNINASAPLNNDMVGRNAGGTIVG